MTVINLYIYEVFLHVKSSWSKLALRKDVHTFNTRNVKMLIFHIKDYLNLQNSYEFLGVEMYNKLKLYLKELPTDIYKAKYYKSLVNNLFYSVEESLECELDIFVSIKIF